MKITIKNQIKKWFEENPDIWISTRELRMRYGEAADRRCRDLRAEGFKIISKRREIDGKKFFTFFWAHPKDKQSSFFNLDIF